MIKPTEKELERLKADAERMLALNSPAVIDEWWAALLAAIKELQERRAGVYVEGK